MRAVVFGYHDIGYVCLQELLAAGAEVCAVLTHEDDPGEEIWFRSVRQLAESHRIPVFAPAGVNTPEWIARVREWAPDFIFSFYYRKLLGTELLRIPRRGALNLHGSLLPKYRGRCPVNWVLVHGERETGVTLHYMEEKPDRGDIVAQRVVAIDDDDTALTLFRKLTVAAAELMRATYPLLHDGRAPRIPQDQRLASYFGGRGPDDGKIDWARDAATIRNLVRAVTHPYPGAFTLWQGRKLLIWEVQRIETSASNAPAGCVLSIGSQTVPGVADGVVVQTGAGALRIVRAQLEGDAERPASECAQRHRITQGAILT
ncbi:MAG TPA: formyltransferase [Candidatus Kryptonia bacterium]|nr:formyltransferase [Candidatus Kryptonia bacterium]